MIRPFRFCSRSACDSSNHWVLIKLGTARETRALPAFQLAKCLSCCPHIFLYFSEAKFRLEHQQHLHKVLEKQLHRVSQVPQRGGDGGECAMGHMQVTNTLRCDWITGAMWTGWKSKLQDEEKIFLNHVLAKNWHVKYANNSQNQNQFNLKMHKDMSSQSFHQKGYADVRWTSLVIREIQIKATTTTTMPIKCLK